MTEPRHYRPSNSAVCYTPPKRIDVGRLIVGSLIGAAGAIAGAIAYAKLQPEMSSPYLRVGAVPAASVATGTLAMFVVRFGRVRSPVMAALIGASLGLLALYVMWIFWVADVMQRSLVIVPWRVLVENPRFFFSLIRSINDTGTWSFQGAVARGAPLTLIWLVEAGG